MKSEKDSLKEKLSKYEDIEPPKNSGNSSVPPSKEKMGQRRTTSLREKSGKKPRGQPGREDNTRIKLNAPDAVETHRPNFCKECGRDLTDIDGHMEFEEECVGLKGIPKTIRHRYMSKTCPCECSNKPDVPKRKNPVYFSDDVRALVVYLNVMMCMPYNRIRSFLSDVMHIDLSEGSIRNFIATAGKKAGPICEKNLPGLSKDRLVERMSRDFT